MSSISDDNQRIIDELPASTGKPQSWSGSCARGVLPVTAGEASGQERDRLFAAQAKRPPQFAEDQQKADRTILVLVLAPR